MKCTLTCASGLFALFQVLNASQLVNPQDLVPSGDSVLKVKRDVSLIEKEVIGLRILQGATSEDYKLLNAKANQFEDERKKRDVCCTGGNQGGAPTQTYVPPPAGAQIQQDGAIILTYPKIAPPGAQIQPAVYQGEQGSASLKTLRVPSNEVQSSGHSRNVNTYKNLIRGSIRTSIDESKLSYKLTTITQRRFFNINYNYTLALAYQTQLKIQSNAGTRRAVVTSPNSISCGDVCDCSAIGYGTLGICTSKYCQCEPTTQQPVEFRCEKNQVFDPLTLKCDFASNTVLCSDFSEGAVYDLPGFGTASGQENTVNIGIDNSQIRFDEQSQSGAVRVQGQYQGQSVASGQSKSYGQTVEQVQVPAYAHSSATEQHSTGHQGTGGVIDNSQIRFDEQSQSGVTGVQGQTYGQAAVSGQSQTYGQAAVSGQSQTYGQAAVSGQSQTYGQTVEQFQVPAYGQTVEQVQVPAYGQTVEQVQAPAYGQTVEQVQGQAHGHSTGSEQHSTSHQEVVAQGYSTDHSTIQFSSGHQTQQHGVSSQQHSTAGHSTVEVTQQPDSQYIPPTYDQQSQYDQTTTYGASVQQQSSGNVYEATQGVSTVGGAEVQQVYGHSSGSADQQGGANHVGAYQGTVHSNSNQAAVTGYDQQSVQDGNQQYYDQSNAQVTSVQQGYGQDQGAQHSALATGAGEATTSGTYSEQVTPVDESAYFNTQNQVAHQQLVQVAHHGSASQVGTHQGTGHSNSGQAAGYGYGQQTVQEGVQQQNENSGAQVTAVYGGYDQGAQHSAGQDASYNAGFDGHVQSVGNVQQSGYATEQQQSVTQQSVQQGTTYAQVGQSQQQVTQHGSTVDQVSHGNSAQTQGSQYDSTSQSHGTSSTDQQTIAHSGSAVQTSGHDSTVVQGYGTIHEYQSGQNAAVTHSSGSQDSGVTSGAVDTTGQYYTQTVDNTAGQAHSAGEHSAYGTQAGETHSTGQHSAQGVGSTVVQGHASAHAVDATAGQGYAGSQQQHSSGSVPSVHQTVAVHGSSGHAGQAHSSSYSNFNLQQGQLVGSAFARAPVQSVIPGDIQVVVLQPQTGLQGTVIQTFQNPVTQQVYSTQRVTGLTSGYSTIGQPADAVVIDATGFGSASQQTAQQSGGLVSQTSDTTRIQAPDGYDVGVVVLSSDGSSRTPLIQQTADSVVVHSNNGGASAYDASRASAQQQQSGSRGIEYSSQNSGAQVNEPANAYLPPRFQFTLGNSVQSSSQLSQSSSNSFQSSYGRSIGSSQQAAVNTGDAWVWKSTQPRSVSQYTTGHSSYNIIH